jgi:hypothetical protein
MNKLNIIRRIFIILSWFVIMCSGGVLKQNGTEASELTAEMLVSLGRQLNNPLITVIGKVMKNYHLCTDWSEWTSCCANKVNFFATRSRSRHCTLIQPQAGESIPEEETGICEGICPQTYNLTTNEYCLKLYNTPTNRDDAEEMCKRDGGSLININTNTKYEDVKALIAALDEDKNIHIDGRRENSTSPWEYSNGSEFDNFLWLSGYPKAINLFSCLMLTGKRSNANQCFLWFNYSCTSRFSFVCETSIYRK